MRLAPLVVLTSYIKSVSRDEYRPVLITVTHYIDKTFE